MKNFLKESFASLKYSREARKARITAVTSAKLAERREMSAQRRRQQDEFDIERNIESHRLEQETELQEATERQALTKQLTSLLVSAQDIFKINGSSIKEENDLRLGHHYVTLVLETSPKTGTPTKYLRFSIIDGKKVELLTSFVLTRYAQVDIHDSNCQNDLWDQVCNAFKLAYEMKLLERPTHTLPTR